MPDFSIRQLAAIKPICPNALSFGQIIEQTIFAKINADTTPEQYQQAQNLLVSLCERFAAKVDLFHFPEAIGRH
jgi:hypothetical protein